MKAFNVPMLVTGGGSPFLLSVTYTQDNCMVKEVQLLQPCSQVHVQYLASADLPIQTIGVEVILEYWRPTCTLKHCMAGTLK